MRITITALLALAFLLTQAQFTHVTLDKSGNPNEPSIAVHPKTKSIVSASNINNFYVKELGDTDYKKIKSTSPLGVYGDPVLHYSDTCLFFAHLAKTPQKEYGDWFDRIVVQKITDPVNWIEKSYSVGYNSHKMQDKPWLCSDNHSARWKGNVYVNWTEFDTYDSDNPLDRSRIRFSKYMASADTFSAAITLSDTTGDCLDSDNTLEGVTTAVGKKVRYMRFGQAMTPFGWIKAPMAETHGVKTAGLQHNQVDGIWRCHILCVRMGCPLSLAIRLMIYNM